MTKARTVKVDLPGLLSRCEENYARLMRLLPVLEGEQQLLVSMAGRELQLQARLVEEGPYTTDLLLRQAPLHPLLNGLDFHIRLYHDARLAEVQNCEGYRKTRISEPYPNPHMHQRDEKKQWNRFLGEWLGYLQRHGQVRVLQSREPVGVGISRLW